MYHMHDYPIHPDSQPISRYLADFPAFFMRGAWGPANSMHAEALMTRGVTEVHGWNGSPQDCMDWHSKLCLSSWSKDYLLVLECQNLHLYVECSSTRVTAS